MSPCMGQWLQSRQVIVETRVGKEEISAGPESEQILIPAGTQHAATA